jgi:anti-sigma factor RsiW
MNFRDVELLSAYLDGQLNPSDSARLESRLKSDSNLRRVMDDLRAARGLLRQLPERKAPRNFTLTRKMIGAKPPLPRAYPTFRFASAFAMVLLLLTFAVNGLAPGIYFGAAAPAAPAFGMGGGGGEPEALEAPAATEAPAAMEAPAAEPSLEMQVVPTEGLPSAEDSSRIAETPQPKIQESDQVQQDQVQVRNDAVIPVSWQLGLAVVILLSGLVAILLRQSSIRKWR